MNLKHKIKHIWWSIVTAVIMTGDEVRQEYNAYVYRAWEGRMTAMSAGEWLHRRWYPRKYNYEHTCPECHGAYPLTTLGLCPNCGQRFSGMAQGKTARPL